MRCMIEVLVTGVPGRQPDLRLRGQRLQRLCCIPVSSSPSLSLHRSSVSPLRQGVCSHCNPGSESTVRRHRQCVTGLLSACIEAEKPVLTRASTGRKASMLVVDCVSIHESIELYNGSIQIVDLGGRALDDEEEAVSQGRSPSMINLDRSCGMSHCSISRGLT